MTLARLPGNEPVDVAVVVECNGNRLIGVHIAVGQRAGILDLVELVFQVVEITEVSSTVLVGLGHRVVEAVTGDADALAQYRRLERQRRQVTLELIDKGLTQHLHIVDGAGLTIVGRHATHAAQVTVQRADLGPDGSGRLFP